MPGGLTDIDVNTTATSIGVFAIVLWLVKVIVVRSGITDADSRTAMTSLETRMQHAMERAVKDAEANCEVKLEAMRSNLGIVARGLELLAVKYPDDSSLQLLIVTLKEKTP